MAHSEVEVDEAMMMARYLSASGGLWPHTGYGSVTSINLVRTSSSPVGSFDAVNSLSENLTTSRSRSLKRFNGQTAAPNGESLRPADADAEPGRERDNDDMQEVPDGRCFSSVTSAIDPQTAEPRQPLTTMSLQPNRGGALGHWNSHTSRGFKPQIRVVDFQVASYETGQGRPAESPLTPARAAQRSGLSLLLNAPA